MYDWCVDERHNKIAQNEARLWEMLRRGGRWSLRREQAIKWYKEGHVQGMTMISLLKEHELQEYGDKEKSRPSEFEL